MNSGWETWLIVGLTVALIAAYALGSIWNRHIQRSFWRALSGQLRRFTRKVSYKSFGSSGFRVGFRLASGPLTKVEIDLVLLSREMPLYLPVAYLSGRRDMVVVKANVRPKPGFSLEVFGRHARLSKQIVVRAKGMRPLEFGALTRFMEIRTSDPAKASGLLSKGLFDRLMALRGCLERFSIAPREPHILIACRRDESAIKPLLDLLEATASAIASLSGPGGPSRGRRGRR